MLSVLTCVGCRCAERSTTEDADDVSTTEASADPLQSTSKSITPPHSPDILQYFEGYFICINKIYLYLSKNF